MEQMESNCDLQGQDQVDCESCKVSLVEKDTIIDNFKRDLVAQESKIHKLEEEAAVGKKNYASLLEEKNYLAKRVTLLKEELDDLKSDQLYEDESRKHRSKQHLEKDDESTKGLEVLQEQLLRLEEEKKHLNEKIRKFENETEELNNIFAVQQEKFEQEMANKDRVIRVLEKERELTEKDSINIRDELEKMKRANDNSKKQIEDLRSSIQEKDEMIINLSDLHNGALEQINKLQREFISSEECLKDELSCRQVLEEKYVKESKEKSLMEKEFKQLQVQLKDFSENNVKLKDAESQLLKQLELLKGLVETLEKGKKNTERDNVKLRHEKENIQNVLEKVNRNAEQLQMNIEVLKNENCLILEQKSSLESKADALQSDIMAMAEIRTKQNKETSSLRKHLEETEQNLESRTVEKAQLEQEIQAMKQATEELKISKGRQTKCMEKVKEELDSMISIKQNLELDYVKLEDSKRVLKEKSDKFFKEIENLQACCAAKTKENEDLKADVNQKLRLITSLREQEQKLQNDIEELLCSAASSGIELKNVKDECGKLLHDKQNIEKNYEKVNVQLQECLSLLEEKREEYITRKNQLEEQLERQIEEASHFRERNAEIKADLMSRDDEIISLKLERQELLTNLDDSRNRIEAAALTHGRLEKEVDMLKQHLKVCDENARKSLEKLSELMKKHADVQQMLELEKVEKNKIESSLAIALKNADGWKKVSQEIKEERNHLQMQVDNLDRDMNKKHRHISEEKSSLEKDMESQRNVVRRLKSNEENLRKKIEDLLDEVDKLSNSKSEQQSQILKLIHDKDKMLETIRDNEKMIIDYTKLQKDNEGTRRENVDLKQQIAACQDRARTTEDENERLQRELLESQNLSETIETNTKEIKRECQELLNENGVLRDCNAEIMNEKQRLLNENYRLKEKKVSVIEERNRLQDMIESLDNCHSEKNDNLTGKNTLLAKEVVSLRETLKDYEEKEGRFLKEMQERNENLQEVMKQNRDIRGSLKKGDSDNKRLRKRVEDLLKEVELIELEKVAKHSMEIELQERKQCIMRLKENEKVLNTLVSSLNQQQNKINDALRNKERELNELNANMETVCKEKAKCKEVIKRLDEELQKFKTRELCITEELRNEKNNGSQRAFVISRLEKDLDDCKNLLERNNVRHKSEVEGIDKKKCKLADRIQKLKSENALAKQFNEDLNAQVQARQEDIRLLKADKIELEGKMKKINEEILELTNQAHAWRKENRSLREHAENLEKIFASNNSVKFEHTYGMEKEIEVLRDTLTQLRDVNETNRAEIDELKSKLEKEKKENINVEIKFNEMRLKQETLQGKNDELTSRCSRLEELVNEEVNLKHEKEEVEKNLEDAKQRKRDVEKELEEKTRELKEANNQKENIRNEIGQYKESLERLQNAKEELITANKELAQRNEQILQEIHLFKEKYDQTCSEKQHLSKLESFHEEELKSLKREVHETKTNLQSKIQEVKADRCQLQDELNTKEEALVKMTEKHQKLLDNIRKVKENAEDLENENEDLLADLEQSRDEQKRVKDVLCTLQGEYENLQDELRIKLNAWNESSEKFKLDKLEMETVIASLQEKLTQAHERTEKQREKEKMLRNEVEEVSDAYVKLEEEIHHCNKENMTLKEKVQELSQSVDELDLARETACLLKEKRQSELLKSEKCVQHMEKSLKEKEKTNQRIMKELDVIIEKQKFLELQLSGEKEVSGHRLKELQDQRINQRRLDEELCERKQKHEKLEGEIETLKLNSNSMRLRIEMLEEELENLTTEKEKIAQLYEEGKNGERILEDEVRKIKLELTQQKISHEERIREITEEKRRLVQELNLLSVNLNRQKFEITGLTTSLDDMTNKNECSRMLISVLHNDIKTKDEQITRLEERKRQMINLLANLDAKIADIQVQAMHLENENDSLRQDLARVHSTELRWNETIEHQAKSFFEKLETASREKQKLQEMKKHFKRLHSNAESEIQNLRTELKKIRAKQQRIIAENASLMESKDILKSEVQEKESAVNKLKQSLNVEKNKTVKLEEEISKLSEDCQSVKRELACNSEIHEKTKYELRQAKTKSLEVDVRLKERSTDLEKAHDILKNVRESAKEQGETLAKMVLNHNKSLQSKEETIESLTKKNQSFGKIVDALTSRLHQCQEENASKEIEKKHLKETLEKEQQRLEDLGVLYKNAVNTKAWLDAEQKRLSEKLKEISKELAKLELEHKSILEQNERLHSENEKKEKDLNERLNATLKENQELEEALSDLKIKLANADTENYNLRQKNEAGSRKQEETISFLKDLERRLLDQQQEKERIKKALQDSILKTNDLQQIHRKVSNALSNLKNEVTEQEPNSPQTRENSSKIYQDGGIGSTDSFQVNQLDTIILKRKEEGLPENRYVQERTTDPLHRNLSLPPKSSDLEISFSEIEVEVSHLRNVITERENEISRHKILLDSLQSEKDILDIQLAKYLKIFENERVQKEKLCKNEIKMKEDMDSLRKEKNITIKDLHAKILNLSKKNAELLEEVDFLKRNNFEMTTKQDEIGRNVNQMEERVNSYQEEVRAKEEELNWSKAMITSCKQKVIWLEERNKELKDINEKNKKLTRKHEEEKEVQFNEIKDLQELWDENLKQLEILETQFNICMEEKRDESSKLQHGIGEYSCNAKYLLKCGGKQTNVNQEKECIIKDLRNRFDKLHENRAFQSMNIKKLQDDLENAHKQWTICVQEMNECKSTKKVVEEKHFELQKNLSTTETKYEEALAKVDEVSTNLNRTKIKLAESNATHEEENQRISRELTKMQIELVSACNKFKKSISETKSQKAKLLEKDERILDLENRLKCSRENERTLTIMTSELETKSKLLLQVNVDLEELKKDSETKVKALECNLWNEREMNEKEISEKQATIGQLKLKLEDTERRGARMKKQLETAENTVRKLQEEYHNAKCRFLENDSSWNTVIHDSKGTILQLSQEVLQLKEDLSYLEENGNRLTKIKERLEEKVFAMDKEIQEYKNFSEEARQEKETIRKILEETFSKVLNENETKSRDLNDLITKLKRVVKMNEDLRTKADDLANNCNKSQKELSLFREENEKLHHKFIEKSDEYESLGQENSKLKKHMLKLEMELDQAEGKYSRVESKLLGLKEDLETMKVKDTQQQYQYKVLEKEKEILEDTAAWTQDKVEDLIVKLEYSLNLRSVLGLTRKSSILDDSGVDIDENKVTIVSKQCPLDSGIFSSDLEKSVMFPTNDQDQTIDVECLRSLETVVEKTMQIMSALDKTFHDRTRQFSEKEKGLASEISFLKQTVNHNDDIRSALETDIKRLDKSQKKFQELFEKKNKDLAACQAELRHLRTAYSDKEKLVEILNHSVQEYQREQEFLESKLDASLKDIEQQKSERSHGEEIHLQCLKTCEELRQTCLTNNVANKKKITTLDSEVNELKNQLREARNVNTQLSTACATLRKTTERFNIQLRKSAARVAELETQLKSSKNDNSIAEEGINDLSRELESFKAVNLHLEMNWKEAIQAYSEATVQQAVVNTEKERAAKEAREAKEETAQLGRANTSLKDQLDIAKQSLNAKENENKQILLEVGEKNESLKNSEAKMKTLGKVLEEINACKDQLERDIDQARRDNEELNSANELLRNEYTSMLEEIKRRMIEIQRKQDEINKLQDMNSGFEKEQSNMSKSQGFEQQGRNSDSISLSQKLSAICTSMDAIFKKCQERVVERQNLLQELLQQNQLLKRTEEVNIELENQKKQLENAVLILSEKCSSLEGLTNVRDELLSAKKLTADLESTNSLLKNQVKQLEGDLSSYVNLSEDLKKNRTSLKEELLKAENELYCLKSKCKHLDNLKEELENTKCAINELKAIHNKSVIEKDDARLEVEHAQKKLKDLENVLMEEKRIYSETQKALQRERERITTLLEVAKMKEKDLHDIKMIENMKDDLIKQLQKQITQSNEETGALEKQFSDVMKESVTLRGSYETVVNEKARLSKKCSMLEKKQDQFEKDRQVLENENAEQKTKISLMAETYNKQKKDGEMLAEEMKLLKREWNINSTKYEQLIDEKVKIIKAMEITRQRLQVEAHELREKCIFGDIKISDLENSLCLLRSMLSESESRNDELKETISLKEVKLADLKDQKIELDLKLEAGLKSIKDLNNKGVHLNNESNNLKKSLDVSTTEKEQLKSDLEQVNQRLVVAKTDFVQKEEEWLLSQGKISSGEQLRQTLRSRVVKRLKDLEDAHDMVCTEKTEMEKMLSHNDEQVMTLQNELDTSIEISELLEKRYLTETESNAALRLEVEAQNDKLFKLDKASKSAFSQFEEMNCEIASLNKKIGHRTDEMEKKEVELSTLPVERKKLKDELQESSLQLKCQQRLNEDAVNSKRQTEAKLRLTTNKLGNSENHLTQEKETGEPLKIDKENLKLEFDGSTTKLKDKIDDFLFQLSVAKAREETLKQELERTRVTIDNREEEMSRQRTKLMETDKKRREANEELSNLKLNYCNVKSKLDQRLKENKKLQDDKKVLKEQVSEIERKLEAEYEESLTKVRSLKQEMEKLTVQLEHSERANQSLHDNLLKMQEINDTLRKEKEEKQHEFAKVLGEKDNEWKEMKSSSNGKDDIIIQLSNKLTTEQRQKEKLNERLFSLYGNLETANCKLEQIEGDHKTIVRETHLLYQMVMETWKLDESEVATAKKQDNKNNRQVIREPIETIGLLRASLELLKDHTYNLQGISSKLKEQLAKSEEDNKKEIIQLEQNIGCLRVEKENLRKESQSLRSSLEKLEERLQEKNVAYQTLQNELNKQKDVEKKMESKIEVMKDDYLALHNEIGVVDRKRLSLEEVLSRVESERNNLTREISARRENAVILQNKNNELSERNSGLFAELSSLQRRMKTIESSFSSYVSENKELRQKHAKAGNELSALGPMHQKLQDEKKLILKKLEEVKQDKIILEVNLNKANRKQAELQDELTRLRNLNNTTMNDNAQLKLKNLQLTEENEKLEADVSSLRRRVDRLENEENNRTIMKTRLQNQLDKAFNSLERQQSKLSQALEEKELLQTKLLEAEKELKVLTEDKANLNQQLRRNQKNDFSSTDEIYKSKNRLSELRRKELALAQENRFLCEKLREKSEELRESKLREEESRNEAEKSRERLRRYIGDRDRWEGETKSVTPKIGYGSKDEWMSTFENNKSFCPGKANNTWP